MQQPLVAFCPPPESTGSFCRMNPQITDLTASTAAVTSSCQTLSACTKCRSRTSILKELRVSSCIQSSGRLRDSSVRGCGLRGPPGCTWRWDCPISSARPPSFLLELHHFASRASGNNELRSAQKRLHHVAAQIIGAQKQVRALERRPARSPEPPRTPSHLQSRRQGRSAPDGGV